MNDLFSAIRSLRSNIGVLVAVVASLGSGMALIVVTLALYHAGIHQPLAAPNQERLVEGLLARVDDPSRRVSLSPAEYIFWKQHLASFESLGAYAAFGSVDLTGEGIPRRLRRHLVTSGFFKSLEISPALGRTFTEDEVSDDAPLVVVSWTFWSSKLASDEQALGRTLLLDGVPFSIIGVMPKGFGARGESPDLWMPLSFGPHRPADDHTSYLLSIARLKDGVSIETARNEVDRLVTAADQRRGGEASMQLDLKLLQEVMVEDVEDVFRLLLLGAVALLLLAASATGVLQLARTEQRRSEFVLRVALGAPIKRLLRLIFYEGLIIGFLAATAGLAGGLILLSLLPNLGGILLYDHAQPQIGLWVMLRALGVAMMGGQLASFLPALNNGIMNRNVAATLGGGPRSATRPSRAFRALTAIQVAAAVSLLSSAFLLVSDARLLAKTDRGFDSSDLVSMDVSLPLSRYAEGARVEQFYSRLLSHLEQIPGVGEVALANDSPGQGWGFRPRSRRTASDEARPSARWLMVAPNYFETLEVPIVEGRSINDTDAPGGNPVTVLSQAAASALFPDKASALGEEVEFNDHWYRVVGIVADVVGDPMKGSEPTCYLPLLQEIDTLLSADIRTTVLTIRTGNSEESVRAVTRAVAEIDPLLPLSRIGPLDDRLDRSVVRPSLTAQFSLGLALLSIVVAVVSVFGVTAHTLAREQRAMGIRLVLGAVPGQLLADIMRSAFWRYSAASVAGLLLGLLLRRSLGSLLFELSAFEPSSFLLAASIVLATGLLASWIPGRRALGLHPAELLRHSS